MNICKEKVSELGDEVKTHAAYMNDLEHLPESCGMLSSCRTSPEGMSLQQCNWAFVCLRSSASPAAC